MIAKRPSIWENRVMNGGVPDACDAPERKARSSFSYYLPRLRREFYQAHAVVFWTMPISNRRQGWLTDMFHLRFRELMRHTAARERLVCPAYCLMPDHIHLVWMGIAVDSDQRNGMSFLRSELGPLLLPFKFQHKAHDHVLRPNERQRHAFSLACADYVLLNPLEAGLVKDPQKWPYLGAIVPGCPRQDVFGPAYWPRFWRHYFGVRQPGIEKRIVPPREME